MVDVDVSPRPIDKYCTLSGAASGPYTSSGGGVQPPLFVLVSEPELMTPGDSSRSLLLNNIEVA